MFRAVAAFLFRASGWKIVGHYPKNIKKAVWAGAPHTSNFDFFVCLGARAELGMKIGFFAKSQLFKWYSGWFFRALGCYPVYRDRSTNMVDSVSAMFGTYDTLHLAITPEGTRKDVVKLKTGFYHIALKANVPLILIGFDYPRKALIISDPIVLQNHFEKDMKVIYDFYLTIHGERKTWIKNYEATKTIVA